MPYGTCTGDSGGDIDLLFETGSKLGTLDCARIKMRIEDRLALPVDVFLHMRVANRCPPFERIALETGVVLEDGFR